MKKLFFRLGAALGTLIVLVVLFFPATLYAAQRNFSAVSEEILAAENPEAEVEPEPEAESVPESFAAQVLLTNYILQESDDATSYVLSVTLANVGGSDADNVLLTFQDESRVFLPAYGTSNQLHIPTIAAGSSVEKDIRLVSEGSVDAFMITFSIKYLNPNTMTENMFYIGSFTGQPVDAVQLLQLELNGTPDENGLMPVRVVVQNRSGQSLDELTLHLHSSLSENVEKVDLGSLDANTTLDKTYMMTLAEGRIQQVRVSLSYTGESGMSYMTPDSLFTLYGYQQKVDPAGTVGVSSLAEKLRPHATELAIHLVLMAIVVVALFVIWVRHRRNAPSTANARRRSKKGDRL